MVDALNICSRCDDCGTVNSALTCELEDGRNELTIEVSLKVFAYGFESIRMNGMGSIFYTSNILM